MDGWIMISERIRLPFCNSYDAVLEVSLFVAGEGGRKKWERYTEKEGKIKGTTEKMVAHANDFFLF